jgi:hypothetical protein
LNVGQTRAIADIKKGTTFGLPFTPNPAPHCDVITDSTSFKNVVNGRRHK